MVLLAWLIDAYSLVVFVAVITSWIDVSPDNPIVRFSRGLTEPVFEVVRRVLPPMGGLDLSPMVVLIALRLLRRLLF